MPLPRKARKTSKSKQPNIHVKLEAKSDTPFYYVNFMTVGHFLYDFTLSAVRLPGELSPDQMVIVKAGQPVVLEPTLQLVIPPSLAKGLIAALDDQVKKYEERFGKILIPVVEGEVKHG